MAQATQSRRESARIGHRFLLLFIFLLATLVLFPFAEAKHVGGYAFRAIGSLTVVVSVYAAKMHRGLLLFAVVLAIPALLERILLPTVTGPSIFMFNVILALVFNVLIVVVLFRHVFSAEQPTSETIFGALCIYLLIGFTFASIYSLVAALQPSAFYLDPTTNLHHVPNRFDFIYYSFSELTALGAAGITPVTDQARSFSIFEAIIGILYLAVLIAGLIGPTALGRPADRT